LELPRPTSVSPFSSCRRHLVGVHSYPRNDVTFLAKRARSVLARVNAPIPVSGVADRDGKPFVAELLSDPQQQVAHLSCAAFGESPPAGICGGMGKLATREAEQTGIVFDAPLELGGSAAAAAAALRMVWRAIPQLLRQVE